MAITKIGDSSRRNKRNGERESYVYFWSGYSAKSFFRICFFLYSMYVVSVLIYCNHPKFKALVKILKPHLSVFLSMCECVCVCLTICSRDIRINIITGVTVFYTLRIHLFFFLRFDQFGRLRSSFVHSLVFFSIFFSFTLFL